MASYLATARLSEITIPQVVGNHKKTLRAFLVAVLDGSDLFAAEHGRPRATEKESAFHAVCDVAIAAADGVDRAPLSGRHEDAAFAEFAGSDSLYQALLASRAIHQQLMASSLELQRNWIDQPHARIVVATKSWATALALLPQANRDETVISPDDWKGFTKREVMLLRGSQDARRGMSAEAWGAMVKQLDEGIELPDENSDLARRARTRFEWWQQQLKPQAAAASA